MPSEFSSSGSVTDAEKLARNLGIAFSTVPIRGIYEEFSTSLEPFFKGTEFGLAEENLQPRIRGSLLMALSNKTGALVLTTGNKSEMACGYCTLYGDMVGALAVIGDVYKTEVYELSRWVNREREVTAEEIVRSQGMELELVRKVIRLVELSEYKRQQAAPVLKVSRKSFGLGRRFPIAARREV